MRTAISLAVAVLLTAAAVIAQRGGGAAPAGANQAPACPASGYAERGNYGMFAQNDDGFTAYAIASPCIGKDVRDVAESIGMGRGKVMGVENVIGVQFKADGTMADGTGMAKLSNAEFHIAYYLPAMRVFLNGTKANGQPLKEIRVFADRYAWNETEQGKGATAAADTFNDRLPLIKLTPFGAVWSLLEAEGHVTVSKAADGKTVLTGTSPYDGIETSITVEDSRQHLKLGPYDPMELIRLPVAVTAKWNGHTYGATFADYRGNLEPNVWMIFPTTIKWTLDGRPLADLKVTFFRSNPYIVFPIPDVAKGTPATQIAAGQLPPSARRAGNLPLRTVQASYAPAGRRVSPQDGYAMQLMPTGQTPRDADGHPDLSGNWTGNIPNVFQVPGLRRNGAFEADQSAMQRGAQWNKPLYKPEYWDKVRSLDYGKVQEDPFYGCYKPLGVPRQNVPGPSSRRTGRSGCSTASRTRSASCRSTTASGTKTTISSPPTTGWGWPAGKATRSSSNRSASTASRGSDGKAISIPTRWKSPNASRATATCCTTTSPSTIRRCWRSRGPRTPTCDASIRIPTGRMKRQSVTSAT